MSADAADVSEHYSNGYEQYPEVYDHYRPAGDRTEAGEADPVFRVVGVADDEVTLLRITDDTGTRRATGDLRHVLLDRLEGEFVPAANPDSGLEPIEYLAALFVVGGAILVAHPGFEALSGALLGVAGLYTFWRRGKLPLPG